MGIRTGNVIARNEVFFNNPDQLWRGNLSICVETATPAKPGLAVTMRCLFALGIVAATPQHSEE